MVFESVAVAIARYRYTGTGTGIDPKVYFHTCYNDNRIAHRGRSTAGHWGGLNYLFHLKSFLKLLFAVENTAVWGAMVPALRIRPRLHKPLYEKRTFNTSKY